MSRSLQSVEGIEQTHFAVTVFAIGANYTSFPGPHKSEVRIHLPYFELASQWAQSVMFDCSLENIQVLVTQCIFLLITSQTDR